MRTTKSFVPRDEADRLTLLMELPEYIDGYTTMRLGLNQKAIPDQLTGDAKEAWLLGWSDSAIDYKRGVNKLEHMDAS